MTGKEVFARYWQLRAENNRLKDENNRLSDLLKTRMGTDKPARFQPHPGDIKRIWFARRDITTEEVFRTEAPVDNTAYLAFENAEDKDRVREIISMAPSLEPPEKRNYRKCRKS